jgi:hypothetical protein
MGECARKQMTWFMRFFIFGSPNLRILLCATNLWGAMKISLLLVLAGVLTLPIMAVPAFATDDFGMHSLTVTTTAQNLSCSDPISVSGTATGLNFPPKHVQLTVTNSDGTVYATGSAGVSHHHYSATLKILSTDGEGILTVTAKWHGQVAVTDNSFYWSC